MSEKLLEVRDLKTYFESDEGLVRAVDGVSFELNRGETLGLVGESGCGKTVTALSIMRLVRCPPGRHPGGEVLLRGRDLMKLSAQQMTRVRGREISMVFQEPAASLNPVHRIGYQIAEPLFAVEKMRKDQAWQLAVDSLNSVHIGNAPERARAFPHQLSGGMKQRAMIAMALVRRPAVLIADEPTTALDVTIQAQILDLMRELQQAYDAAVLLITHDMGVVAEMTHRVAVMYAGKIVETASTDELFADPLHPYTQALMACVPLVTGPREELKPIPGQVPSLVHPPPGCRFHPRCPRITESSRTEEPRLREVKPGHLVACHNV